MIKSRSGGIINVSSASAFLRFPRDAAYIASKSYLVAFTECLALDLVQTGIKVQALCPGWVISNFINVGYLNEAGYKSPIPKWLHIPAEKAVVSSIKSLGKRRIVHIPTMRARFITAIVGSRFGQFVLVIIRKLGIAQYSMPGD